MLTYQPVVVILPTRDQVSGVTEPGRQEPVMSSRTLVVYQEAVRAVATLLCHLHLLPPYWARHDVETKSRMRS